MHAQYNPGLINLDERHQTGRVTLRNFKMGRAASIHPIHEA